MNTNNSIEAINLRIAVLKARGTDNGKIVKKLERRKRALLKVAD